MSSLRAAMAAVDEFKDSPEHEAHQEVLLKMEYEVQDAITRGLTMQREDERQAREDAATADATEIVMRARARVGRAKWSATEGRIIRQIVEALRGLVGDEL